jgi:hypothetical protein
MDELEMRHVVALYDGEIRFTDHHIGRLLDALDEHGLTDAEESAASQPAISRLLLASADIGVWDSLRLERTKYLRMTTSSRTVEAIFDLSADPHERKPRDGADVAASLAAARLRLDAMRDAESAMQEKLKAKGTTAGALPKELEDELRQLGYVK